MPAFGKDGIHNLNQSVEKPAWEVVTTEGKVLMICDKEEQANSHRLTLSQRMNKELFVRKKELKCL